MTGIGTDDAIRAFMDEEARRAVAVAPSLDEAVGRLAPRVVGRPSGASQQRLMVLLAATLLLAAAVGTIAIGSGLLRLPVVVVAPGFAGEWASTDYGDQSESTIQTMTIRAEGDGALHVTVQDVSSILCSDTATTMTGTARFEDPSTLVVPSPTLTCVDGSDPSDVTLDGVSRLEAATSSYTLVLDVSSDRLYDNRGVVWNRGAPRADWADPSTPRRLDQSEPFAILHGEVTFRAGRPWDDHPEAYIDPAVFFLLGPDPDGPGGGDSSELTIFVNPLPPAACEASTTLGNTRVPPSAAELVQAVTSNPNLEVTPPVTERVGGIDALRVDVVPAPGAPIGPCGAADVDVVYVPGRPWGGVDPDGHGRLYVLDLPGGSARTLAIWIAAREAALFEQAVDAAAPVLDAFEFHAP